VLLVALAGLDVVDVAVYDRLEDVQDGGFRGGEVCGRCGPMGKGSVACQDRMHYV
jgi:basic membrane lipoprotein Med (substrate-binding protein (PBP1-ABC) superfamily)